MLARRRAARRARFHLLRQVVQLEDAATESSESDLDPVSLDRAARFAKLASCGMAVALVLVWPLPMVLSRYVFSQSCFRFWVALGLTWAIVAGAVVTMLPLYESRDGLAIVGKGVLRQLAALVSAKGERQPTVSSSVPQSSAAQALSLNTGATAPGVASGGTSTSAGASPARRVVAAGGSAVSNSGGLTRSHGGAVSVIDSAAGTEHGSAPCRGGLATQDQLQEAADSDLGAAVL